MAEMHEFFSDCEHSSHNNDNYCFRCGALKKSKVNYKKNIF